MIPSPGEWQRLLLRARGYEFDYPWIPASAQMTQEKGPGVRLRPESESVQADSA